MELNNIPEPSSGEEAYRRWQIRIRDTLKWRNDYWNGDRAWKQAASLVKGNHWGGEDFGREEATSSRPRDLITVNVVGSMVEDMVPFLLRQNPEFLVRPRSPEYVDTARTQQTLLNYIWQEKNMSREVRLAVRDFVIFGHGIVKTGFRHTFMDGIDAGAETKTLTYATVIKTEEPWIRRVSPHNFLFDPESENHDLDSSRWCAELILKPKELILATKYYSKKVRNKIRSGEVEPTKLRTLVGRVSKDSGLGDDLSVYNLIDSVDPEAEDLEEMIVLWEVWDKKFSKRYLFADNVLEPLVEESWDEYLKNEFPYKMVRFIDLADEPYPLGMVYAIADQQYELNRIRTKQFDEHRRIGTLLATQKGAFANDELRKLQSGRSLEVLEYEARPGNMASPISSISMPTTVYSSAQVESVIKEDIRTISGADALLQGGTLKSRTSATEVRERSEFLGRKLEDKLHKVDYFVSSIGAQVLMHMQANYKLVHMILPLGVDAAEITAAHFMRISPSNIAGEFTVDLNTVSAERVERSVERQQRLQVFQLVMQNLQILMQSGTQINVPAILSWLLESFDIKDHSRFLVGTPGVPQVVGEPGQEVSLDTVVTSPKVSAMQRESSSVISDISGRTLGGLSGGFTGGNIGNE